MTSKVSCVFYDHSYSKNIMIFQSFKRTRPRGLMLTCERTDFLVDLSCKFKSF